MILTLLDRMIARHVLFGTVVVLSVLLGLTMMIDLAGSIADYGKADFGLVALIKYVVFSQPRQIYELFPIAALIGTVMGMSTLAFGSELTAMRAAGISIARIVGATLKIGFVFSLATFLVGEYLVPVSENLALVGRAKALAVGFQQTTSGVWLRSGTSFINIGEVLPDLSLLRLTIYEFDRTSRLRSQTFARHARYEGDKWRLEEVSQSIIVGQEAVKILNKPTEEWQSGLGPEVVAVFAVQPESLSIRQLRYYLQHLEKNNQDTRSYRLVFWEKVFLPLATIVMTLLATPFVFRHNRSGGVGQRVLTGILLGLTFVVLGRSFGYFGLLYGLPPVAGVLLPIVLFLLFGLYLLRRAGRE